MHLPGPARSILDPEIITLHYHFAHVHKCVHLVLPRLLFLLFLFTTLGRLMDGINDVHDDENTPLLDAQSSKQGRTPLPWLQISIILLLQTCEPICSQSIYPYVNEVCIMFTSSKTPVDVSRNSWWVSWTLLVETSERLGIMLG